MRGLATPPLVQQVFAALADGLFCSGTELAQRAGVTRSAVWKAIEQLRGCGAIVHAVTGRGYRLATPTSALDAARIHSLLAGWEDCVTLDVAWSPHSTNEALLAQDPPPADCYHVLLAEQQLAGRGRRGRPWFAPLGGAICMSIAASFMAVPRDASALSLAMGVCALRALRPVCDAGLKLKWPNDIVAPSGKLGGILIELRAESRGPAHLVVGVGVNVRLDAAIDVLVRQTGTIAADLAGLGVDPLARNEIAARLIVECLAGIRAFSTSGFSPFAAEWRAADALRDKCVSVSGAGVTLTGIARGIDACGALQLATAAGPQSVTAGDVSVRAQP